MATREEVHLSGRISNRTPSGARPISIRPVTHLPYRRFFQEGSRGKGEGKTSRLPAVREVLRVARLEEVKLSGRFFNGTPSGARPTVMQA